MPRRRGVTPRKPHAVVVGDVWWPQRREHRTQGRTITFVQDARVFYVAEDGKEHRITLQSWRDWVAMYASTRTALEEKPAEQASVDLPTLRARKRYVPRNAASALDEDLGFAGLSQWAMGWGGLAAKNDPKLSDYR